jgi:hypothetical protein
VQSGGFTFAGGDARSGPIMRSSELGGLRSATFLKLWQFGTTSGQVPHRLASTWLVAGCATLVLWIKAPVEVPTTPTEKAAATKPRTTRCVREMFLVIFCLSDLRPLGAEWHLSVISAGLPCAAQILTDKDRAVQPVSESLEQNCERLA